MAKLVNILSVTNLSQQGFDGSAAPAPDKVTVTGKVVITTYTAGGEPIKPGDFGLKSIDYVAFYPIYTTISAAAVLAGGASLDVKATYSPNTGLLTVTQVTRGTGAEVATDTGSTSAAGYCMSEVRFIASGTSSNSVRALP